MLSFDLLSRFNLPYPWVLQNNVNWEGRYPLDHTNDKDNGGTPVMNDQLNAQAASLRQNKHTGHWPGTLGEY